MKLFPIFILLVLISTIQAQAQDPRSIDSLVNALKTIKPDSTKANLLYTISKAYWGTGGDQSNNYAKQCLELSQKLNYQKGIGDAWNSIGVNHDDRGEFSDAIEAYQQSLKVRIKAGLKNDIGRSYGNLAIVYKNWGNEALSLEFALKAIKIFEELDDKSSMIRMKQLITYSYIQHKKHDIAKEKIAEIIKMATEIDDQYFIGISYQDLGGIALAENKLDDAIRYFKTAIKKFEELDYQTGIAQVCGNLSIPYALKKDMNECMKYLFKSLEIYEKLDNKSEVCSQLNRIIGNYLDMGKVAEAKKLGQRSIDLALQTGSVNQVANAYSSLSNIEIESGNFKLALEYYRKYIHFRDSFSNSENTQRVIEQRMKYEFDKKEAVAKAEQANKEAFAQKEIQKQRLIRNIFFGSFIVMLLFAFVFFFQRNKISKGKKLSDELLLNILPEEVAEELKLKGNAEAKQFDDVTVMFTDFKDFTKISEKLTPTELVEEIHHCFKAFDQIITKYNIEKIKTIGDSYMCVGGLPVKNSTHANDTVKAALEMQAFLHQYSMERKQQGKESFEMRIGIHTGTVVAGIVGVKKFAYDIWGDTVNIASRMESSGEPQKVNISSTTYELVKDNFKCTYRGKISAKSKGEIDMYFVEMK